ncbi:hypothetical protein [Azohydromonas aeria]|nr:hypothetical protein [Azohydromonas aeria]
MKQFKTRSVNDLEMEKPLGCWVFFQVGRFAGLSGGALGVVCTPSIGRH